MSVCTLLCVCVCLTVTMVEHSTSTTKVTQVVPEVKFTTHSLSYAQRLMLKQHRRTDVGQLTSPRLGSYGSSVTPSSGLTSITPRSSVGRGGGFASDDDDGGLGLTFCSTD